MASSASKELPNAKYIRRGRRPTVCAKPIVLDAAWKARVVPKSGNESDRIRTVVSANILFRSLSTPDKETIVGAMERKFLAEGETIINQGDAGDNFYVVDAGNCDIFVNGIGKVAQSGPGGSFGELALMYDAPRAASVTATEATTLWALDQDTFKKTVMSSTMRQRERHEKFLETVSILGGLTPYERMTVADALKERTFPAGTTVLQEGEVGSEFYIIENGEVKCTKKNVASEVSPRLGPGAYFGERALLTNEARAATVTAVTDVVCQMLDRDTFQRILGPLEDTFRRNMQVYAQYKDVLPAGLSEGKSAAEGKGHE